MASSTSSSALSIRFNVHQSKSSEHVLLYSSGMDTIRWKLREFLEEHSIHASQVVDKAQGKLSRTGIYRLTDEELKGVRFESLAVIIPALRELTGEDVQVGDLLEYVGEEPPRKKTWRDLIGAGGSVDGPTDIAERHDEYLGEAELREHEQMHLLGER